MLGNEGEVREGKGEMRRSGKKRVTRKWCDACIVLLVGSHVGRERSGRKSYRERDSARRLDS